MEYPDSDESVGQAYIAWLEGNSRDIDTRTALALLWSYLTDTAVSPIQAAFVEDEDPYCSDVGVFSMVHSISSSVLCFSGVALDKIDNVLEKYVGCNKRKKKLIFS